MLLNKRESVHMSVKWTDTQMELQELLIEVLGTKAIQEFFWDNYSYIALKKNRKMQDLFGVRFTLKSDSK